MTAETIIAEVERLIGRPFEASDMQRVQLDTLQDDVADILRGLPLQLDDLRNDAAAAIEGLEPSDIEPHEVAHLLTLNRFKTGNSSNNKAFVIKKMGWRAVYDIGFRKGRAERGPISPQNEIAALYLDVLGRPHDQAGFAFWSDQLRQGMPLPDIRAEFERVAKSA